LCYSKFIIVTAFIHLLIFYHEHFVIIFTDVDVDNFIWFMLIKFLTERELYMREAIIAT
jgi:hypothetical protein